MRLEKHLGARRYFTDQGCNALKPGVVEIDERGGSLSPLKHRAKDLDRRGHLAAGGRNVVRRRTDEDDRNARCLELAHDAIVRRKTGTEDRNIGHEGQSLLDRKALGIRIPQIGDIVDIGIPLADGLPQPRVQPPTSAPTDHRGNRIFGDE
ncbi:hypothetical protein D3C87_1422120 [compost metagenome]